MKTCPAIAFICVQDAGRSRIHTGGLETRTAARIRDVPMKSLRSLSGGSPLNVLTDMISYNALLIHGDRASVEAVDPNKM